MRLIRAFLLFFVTTLTRADNELQTFSELEESVKNNGIVALPMSRNKILVSTSRTSFEIYDNDIGTYPEDNTLTKFYTCINCVLAKKTWADLLSLISTFSAVLYDQPFTNEGNNLFSTNFLEEYVVMDRIMSNMRQIVKVLLYLQDIYASVNDTTVDTDMSTMLLTLNFKISYIKTAYDEDAGISDTDAVRAILESINSIRQFVYANCGLPENDKETYSVRNMMVGRAATQEFDMFVGDIEPLNLDTREMYCDVGNTTLEMLILENFQGIKWKTNYGTAIVENVAREIRLSYDLRIIFWYQKYVFDTIIKLLFSKTIEYLKRNHTFSQKIVKCFKKIDAFIQEINNIPIDLTTCFALLTMNVNAPVTDALVPKLTEYVDSLDHVVFQTDSNLTEEPSDDYVSDVSINNVSTYTLPQFLRLIMVNIENFKCFVRLLKYLSDRNDTQYYRPFEKHSEVVAEFEKKVSNNNGDAQTASAGDKVRKAIDREACEFFGGLYELCAECVAYLNSAAVDMTVVDGRLNAVRMYLIRLIERYWYAPYYRVAFNVLLMVETRRRQRSNDVHTTNLPDVVDDTIRLTHVIMAEFNAYTVHRCNPFAHRSLFENGYDDRSSDDAHERVKTSLANMKAAVAGAGRQQPKHRYSPVVYTFQTVFNVPDFRAYDRLIWFNWKGIRKPLSNVHVNLVSSVSSVTDLYAFYGLSLKFVLAVLFYEIHMAGNYLLKFNSFSAVKYNPDERKFPRALAEVVVLTADYVKMLNTDDYAQQTYYVVEKFKQIGVHIDLTQLPSVEPWKAVNGLTKLSKSIVRVANQKIKVILDIAEQINNTFSLFEHYGIA